MSEALDDSIRPGHGVARVSRLRFTPDDSLDRSLRAFFTAEALDTTARGHGGPVLYADEPVSEYEQPSSGIPRRGGTESAAIVALSMAIERRSRQKRELGRRLQLEALPKETPGISVKLDVILDPLTAAALQGFVRIGPDRSVGVHMNVRRSELVRRDEYLAACHHLVQQLMSEGRRPGVDAVALVRTMPDA